jgi:PPOX class probable F420-dependent enzyme
MTNAPARVQSRLETEHNVWLASVRPDGRPHLVPVWFAWHDGKLYVCIEPESVKGRNIRQNPRLALALENGSTPVICEGTAAPVSAPWPEAVRAVFQQKYDWDIFSDAQYTQLLEVMPEKWLVW